MKKVLIALDYDPTAQKVVKAGYSLAKALEADVFLLHVMAEISYYSSLEYSPIVGFTGFVDMGTSPSDSAVALKKASQQFLDKTKQQMGEKNTKTIVKEGSIAESILQSAMEVHADIIVMGSHSRKWLENIVMGSITESVLKDTSIPVFIIPTKK